jgi:hypothetical protein
MPRKEAYASQYPVPHVRVLLIPIHMLRIHIDDLDECESLIGDVLCVARAG